MEFPPNPIKKGGPQLPSSVLGKRRRVGLVYDERMCKHSTPNGEPHPENPDRIRAIWNKLVSAGIPKRCVMFGAKRVEDKYVAAVHTNNHINLIKAISSQNLKRRKKVAVRYDSIYFNEGSSDSAYLAAGSVLEAAEKVAKGELTSAFAIVRPPGHHAERSEPMGFCLFNNVAIAASYLLNQKELGINKILLVDWDIHHGNGTQNMFWEDPRVLVFSVHRHEHGSFYPPGDDGSHIMMGEGPGAGYNINVPWENGQCGDADYIAVWDHILIPVAKEFKPDIILVSAGFDAAIDDPLGGCCVTPQGFSIMLKKLMEFSTGKIIMALEGGYNLKSLANSVLACIEVLLEDKPIAGSMKIYPLESTWAVIKAVREQLSAFWPILADKLPIKLTSRVKPQPQICRSQPGDDRLNTSSEDVTAPLRDLDHNGDANDRVTVSSSDAWKLESSKDVATIKNEVLAIKEGIQMVVKSDKELKNKLLAEAAKDRGEIKNLKEKLSQRLSDIANLDSEIVAKGKMLADKDKEIEALKQRHKDQGIEVLKKQLNDALARENHLKDSLVNLLTEAAKDHAQIKDLSEKLSRQPSVVALNKTLADKEKELEALKQHVTSLEVKVQEIEVLENLLKDALAREKQLKDALARVMQPKDSLRAQVVEAKQEQRLLISKFMPHALNTLFRSDEFRFLILKIGNLSYQLGVQESVKYFQKEVFPNVALEDMTGYDGTVLDRWKEAYKELNTMDFPYLKEIVANADKPLEFLMNIKPKKLIISAETLGPLGDIDNMKGLDSPEFDKVKETWKNFKELKFPFVEELAAAANADEPMEVIRKILSEKCSI